MPYFNSLRTYFEVDNVYVCKKLLLVLFPFRHRYPRPVSTGICTSNGNSQDETLSEGHDSSMFGQPYVSPTASYYANKNNIVPVNTLNCKTNFKNTHIDKHHTSVLPTQDYFSFDLYIPLMGIITYIILSAFIFGLSHHRSVTA